MSNPLLNVPAAGLTTAQAYLNAIGNEAANADTPGFGASLPVVADASPYPGRATTAAIEGVAAPGLLGLDAGSVVATTPTAWAGTPTPTETPTNLAISGNGFFVVQTPSGGIAYTRAGDFTPDANGQLVLPNGSRLIPPVTIPPGATWSIGSDGQVTVNHVVQAPIQLATFANPGALLNLGDNLWGPSADSGAARLSAPGTSGVGTLVPGAVNGSGVSMSATFTDLIAAQSAYEANATALKVGQQALQSLTSQPL